MLHRFGILKFLLSKLFLIVKKFCWVMVVKAYSRPVCDECSRWVRFVVLGLPCEWSSRQSWFITMVQTVSTENHIVRTQSSETRKCSRLRARVIDNSPLKGQAPSTFRIAGLLFLPRIFYFYPVTEESGTQFLVFSQPLSALGAWPVQTLKVKNASHRERRREEWPQNANTAANRVQRSDGFQ